MITARLRSAGKGSSSRVGLHHISWLDLFYCLRFTKDSLYRSYLIPSPKSSRCQGHWHQKWKHGRLCGKGSRRQPGGNGRNSSGNSGSRKSRSKKSSSDLLLSVTERWGWRFSLPPWDFLRGLVPSQCSTVTSWVPHPPLGPCPWHSFSSPQRAVAAERRLAAQLGAPTPQIPDSAVVNAGYVAGGRSDDGWTMFGQVEWVPTDRLLKGCEPMEWKQKWQEEGQGYLHREVFGYLYIHFSSSVQTLLELWDVPPRPHSLSLPWLLFLLHTLPPNSSLSGQEALFLISHSSNQGQL